VDCGIRTKTAGLYIHVPFCRRKCSYCNFFSVTSLSSIPDFLDALLKEMEMVCERAGSFDTVYIGGGTPSILSGGQLEGILMAIRKSFSLSSDTEITLEANPADLSLSLVRSLFEMGVNRLNIGIQSFDEEILAFLGRRHSVKEAILSIENSRRAGFENIGLDLIYGVPGQDMELWQHTLSQALVSAPEHLSCYQLTLEAETSLGIRYRKRDFSLPGEALEYDFFMKTAEGLEDAGYIHYEVSNFARNALFISRHNQKYWDHTPYLGLGPAAHSFSESRRWWNHRSVDEYINDINAGRLPVEEMEMLTVEERRLEALFLGLRTKRGIHLKEFAEQYEYDLLAEKKEALAKLQEEGLLSIQNGYAIPTRAGLALADSLALI
jgi:oxygen-independent coproporphyrinogen III oxidase